VHFAEQLAIYVALRVYSTEAIGLLWSTTALVSNTQSYKHVEKPRIGHAMSKQEVKVI